MVSSLDDIALGFAIDRAGAAGGLGFAADMAAAAGGGGGEGGGFLLYGGSGAERSGEAVGAKLNATPRRAQPQPQPAAATPPRHTYTTADQHRTRTLPPQPAMLPRLRSPLTRCAAAARPLARLYSQTVSTTPTPDASATNTTPPVPDGEQSRRLQAPNRQLPWSRSQRPRALAMVGPRFEQTTLERQVYRLHTPLSPDAQRCTDAIHSQPRTPRLS